MVQQKLQNIHQLLVLDPPKKIFRLLKFRGDFFGQAAPHDLCS
jgi:hypothetical protein